MLSSHVVPTCIYVVDKPSAVRLTRRFPSLEFCIQTTVPQATILICFLHNCAVEAWAKHGIKVWSGAGVIKDHKAIFEFTDLSVDYPDCMVLDQSINNTWKNLKYGCLNKKFQRRKPSRQTNGRLVLSTTYIKVGTT